MNEDVVSAVLAERERIRRGVELIMKTDEEDCESHSVRSLEHVLALIDAKPDRDLDWVLNHGERLIKEDARHPYLAQLGDA